MSRAKKAFAAAAILLVLAAAAAYFILKGETYEIRLTEQQIQERLDQKFPIAKKYLLIFDVAYSNPKVHLVEGSDRIQFGLETGLTFPFGGETKTLTGDSQIRAGLRYDAASHEFYLVDPQIDRLDIQGIPPALTTKSEAALKAVAQDILERYPVYTIKPTDIKKVTARMILKSVVANNGELIITLGL
jgi:Protein of unknown function (DUF1439)